MSSQLLGVVNSVCVVYLWGLMGAGKSHSGRVLAKQFGVNFIDLDIQIEQKSGRSISKIFEESGESEFRKIEFETLQSLHLSEHTIVAVGGGTPCFHDNDLFMLQHGICIWLNPVIEILLDRLLNNAGTRPLLVEDKAKMRETMLKLLDDRVSYYNRAHFIVNSHDQLREIMIDQKFFTPSK